MDTWLNYQIDWLQRCFHRKFTKKEVLFAKWFLQLSDKDQKVFIALINRKKDEIKQKN